MALHDLARAHPDDPIPAGERGVRADRIHQREWPVGNVRWTRTFRAGPFTLLALGTAFRHREGSTVQANISGAPALTRSTHPVVTPDLQLGFRNGIS